MMNLPHLKMGKTGNAKYRRRITSPEMRAMLGVSAVEWSLRTRDPLTIAEKWKVLNDRFEALQVQAEGTNVDRAKWEVVSKAAEAHGLVTPGASKIGPVDFEFERGRFNAFTDAASAEFDRFTPQQQKARYGNNTPPSSG